MLCPASALEVSCIARINAALEFRRTLLELSVGVILGVARGLYTSSRSLSAVDPLGPSVPL